jgi:hypothetical protein
VQSLTKNIYRIASLTPWRDVKRQVLLNVSALQKKTFSEPNFFPFIFFLQKSADLEKPDAAAKYCFLQMNGIVCSEQREKGPKVFFCFFLRSLVGTEQGCQILSFI